MKEIYKDAQRGLKEFFGYTGKVDGDIGLKSETALNRIHWLNSTGWDRERKALAYVQFRLNSKGADLKIDGLWGVRSRNAWAKLGPNGGKGNPKELTADEGWMQHIEYVPRWNHDSRPKLSPTGIVLHRTAGHFHTGDFKVGKWGNYRGQSHKGKSLGFHFLIGKEEGEWIQFCSIDRHVSHVKFWSSSYVGIEFSGDVGQYKDGYKHGENLTKWQIEAGVRVIDWVCGKFNIPKVEVTHQNEMFQLEHAHHGLVAHRDLSKNDHADSPNKSDWKKIMDKLSG